MNKAETREVQKAVAFASIDARYAAATLASVMRTARAASLAQMVQTMDANNLRQHMTQVNGCWVAL